MKSSAIALPNDSEMMIDQFSRPPPATVLNPLMSVCAAGNAAIAPCQSWVMSSQPANRKKPPMAM